MKTRIIFSLLFTSLTVIAADNNKEANLRAGQRDLFLGRRAIQQGKLESAKQLFEESARLGNATAAELLVNWPQVAVERNQKPLEIAIKRNQK